MNITCYIVDDEYHVISTLREYISEVPYLELIGFNSNPEKGLVEVNRLAPDLVFWISICLCWMEWIFVR
ncbi:hypothetical protein [Pedobacter sp. NJ-S-72]